jgi:hypothetical protein
MVMRLLVLQGRGDEQGAPSNLAVPESGEGDRSLAQALVALPHDRLQVDLGLDHGVGAKDRS